MNALPEGTGPEEETPHAWARALEATLRAAGTPERAEHEKRYLRSELEHVGATVPTVRSAVKRLLRERVPDDHGATVALARALWGRPVHELRLAAAVALAERQASLTATDLPLLERMLREARTWALVDVLAPDVVGPLARREPEVRETLRRWAADPDHWVRRAAVLAYLLPLRRGEPVLDEFAALADPLLEDREFFVRKAIGWALRERTKSRPEEVVAWLLPRRGRASRLTLREAARRLPPGQRGGAARRRVTRAIGPASPRPDPTRPDPTRPRKTVQEDKMRILSPITLDRGSVKHVGDASVQRGPAGGTAGQGAYTCAARSAG